MASPTVHADETLKALSRYMAGHPRVLWRYLRQEWTGKVWGLTDSNWAACPVTCRACRTLGLKSLMSDLSLDVKAELVTDSSACKGLCSRRGSGKIRHIHWPALWLQHAVARRQIAIIRRAGKDLKAGIPEDTVWRLLGMVGLAKCEGRAKQALNMAGRQAKA